MIEQFIDSALMYNLALTLFHFLWQGVLVALFLKCALVIVPWKNAQGRYLASTFAMIANLALPIFTFFYISQHSSSLNTDLAKIQDLALVSNGFSVPGSAAFNNNLVEYSTYIGVFWLATVLFLASRIFIELYSVNQLPKKGNLPVSDQLMARFGELVERIGLKRMPRLIVSVKVQVPMAIGWLKPAVLIPASMITGLTPAQLDMLLLHELAHIRRHDYLVNFLQTLIEILLFFHPCVYWVSKQMRNEREYCSDDIAVHHCGDPIAYAHTLADTASLCKKHRHMPIPNIAMAASGGDLKQRVVRLVDHHCTANGHSAKWLASIAAIATIMLLATKQLITAPFIDLSSGHFSLSHFGNTPNSNSQTQSNNVLAETSLAQQLLTQESPAGLGIKREDTILQRSEYQVPPSKVEERFVKKNLSKQAAVESKEETLSELHLAEATSFKLASNNKESQNARSVAAPSINKETVRAPSLSGGVSNKTLVSIENPKARAKIDTNTASLYLDTMTTNSDAELDRLSDKNRNLSKTSTSSAEAAFAKTDSANANSSMANPYASQISALDDIPVTQETINLNAVNPGRNNLLFDTSSMNPLRKSNGLLPEAVNAHILHSVEPKYPSMAKRKGIELDVMVHFTIDKQGHVRNIEFERKNKVNYFRTSIRNAVAKWRFQPAHENGRAVESKLSKIFSFSLLK